MARTICWILLCLVAGAGVGRAQEPPAVAPVVTPPPFDTWLAELRSEALSRGIKPDIVQTAFADIQPVAQILERDRTQAEFSLDLNAYLKRRLTRATVRTAQRMYSQHRALLRKIGQQYGVSPRVVVSIWGLESNFGRFAGVRPTIPTLVTLAYDPRRATMFRNELFSALEILSNGDITLDDLKGSWAGALGQPQFMPSSYLQYAQDFDGDGRRDIWTSAPDVFASVAYYLKEHGWTLGTTWGREVRLPKTLRDTLADLPRREEGCRAERLMTTARPLKEWRTLGVRTLGRQPLPNSTRSASLVVAGPRAFLVYDNYDAILGYNCAHSYALSVALLSDKLK